jgi:hypothetical protein
MAETETLYQKTRLKHEAELTYRNVQQFITHITVLQSPPPISTANLRHLNNLNVNTPAQMSRTHFPTKTRTLLGPFLDETASSIPKNYRMHR